MRILITNNTFDQPAGTELWVWETARELRKRGHEVVAYSRQLGEIAGRIRGSGTAVVGAFDEIPGDWTPDVINGHHQWETCLAAMRFPGTPVISFCHGPTPWQESPCDAPNVVRYVAIDEDCLDRLAGKERVTLLLNGVDLDRFPPRGRLPERVGRVLVFSNYAREGNYLAVIREACRLEGVTCEAIGTGVGRVVAEPTGILADSDLVFAKGKAALEAIVTGCGVVVCDEPGIGPMVTAENFDALRGRSFSYSCMPEPVTVERVRERISGWNSEATAAARDLARETASLEATVDRLVVLYEESIAEWGRSRSPGPEIMARWATTFFAGATAPYKLGREMQAIWRLSGDKVEPENPGEETVEMNRILHAFRNAESRVARCEERIAKQESRIARLREKLDARQGDGSGTPSILRRLKFWR